MDNPKKFRVLEWCAGYGGIGLGLKRAIPNMLTVAFSEIEAYACANLVAKMEAGLLDSAPIWTDIKTFPNEEFRGKIDMLIAGYPCQPFSAAGKRLGTEDPRHLWPHIRKSVRIIRPTFVYLENVKGHVSLGLSTVIADLEEDGYTVEKGIFSSQECGADHERERVFILAYLDVSSTARFIEQCPEICKSSPGPTPENSMYSFSKEAVESERWYDLLPKSISGRVDDGVRTRLDRFS